MKTEYKFTTEETKEIILAGMSVLYPTIRLGKEPKVTTHDTYNLGMRVTPDTGESDGQLAVRKRFWQT